MDRSAGVARPPPAAAAPAALAAAAAAAVAVTAAPSATAAVTAFAAIAGGAPTAATASTAEEVPKRKRVNLTEGQRREAIEELLRSSNKGVLVRGDIKRVADSYKCNPRQISTVWKRHEQQKANGVVVVDLANRRKGRSGRRGINLDYLREALKTVPVESRTSQRAVAVALGIPHTTLHNNLKKLGLKAAPRCLKPLPMDTVDDTRLVLLVVVCGLMGLQMSTRTYFRGVLAASIPITVVGRTTRRDILVQLCRNSSACCMVPGICQRSSGSRPEREVACCSLKACCCTIMIRILFL